MFVEKSQQRKCKKINHIKNLKITNFAKGIIVKLKLLQQSDSLLVGKMISNRG